MNICLKNSNSKSIIETKISTTLNNKGNKTIDICSNVDLIFYSNTLLHLSKRQQRRFIEDMYIISELKEFYDKTFKYTISEQDIHKREKLFIDYVKALYKEAASKYDLKMVEE